MGINLAFKGLSIGTIVAFKSFFSTFRCNMVYSLRTVRVADFLAGVKPWTSHVRSSANHSSVIFVCVQDTWHPKCSVTKHVSPVSVQLVVMYLHAFYALLCHGAQNSFMLILSCTHNEL